jgi:hypothetical protein
MGAPIMMPRILNIKTKKPLPITFIEEATFTSNSISAIKVGSIIEVVKS